MGDGDIRSSCPWRWAYVLCDMPILVYRYRMDVVSLTCRNRRHHFVPSQNSPRFSRQRDARFPSSALQARFGYLAADALVGYLV